MKQFQTTLFLLLFFLFSLQLEAQTWKTEVTVLSEGQTGTLEIQTIPSGVKITIDQVFKGLSPQTFTNQRPRNLYLRLEKDGYRPQEGRITLAEGRKILLTASLIPAKGQLEIKGAPEGALLNLDSEKWDRTIVNPLILDAGMHRITLKAFGFQEQSQSIGIKDGETTVVEYVPIDVIKNDLRAKIIREELLLQAPPAMRRLVLTMYSQKAESFSIQVLDPVDQSIKWEAQKEITKWIQDYNLFDLKDSGLPLHEGNYILRILTGESVTQDLSFTINSQKSFTPRLLTTGLSGLLFTSDGGITPTGHIQGNHILFGSSDGNSINAQIWGSNNIGLPFELEVGQTMNYFFNQNKGELGVGTGLYFKKLLLGDDSGVLNLGAQVGFNWAWATPDGGLPAHTPLPGPPLGAMTGLGFALPGFANLNFLGSIDFIYGPLIVAQDFIPRGSLGLGLKWSQDWGYLGTSGKVFSNNLYQELSPRDWVGGLEIYVYDKEKPVAGTFMLFGSLIDGVPSLGAGLGMGYF